MTHPSLRTATWLGLSRGLNPEEYGIASEVETYGYHGNSRVDAGPPNSRQNLSCPISQITGRCLHRLCQRPEHGVRPLIAAGVDVVLTACSDTGEKAARYPAAGMSPHRGPEPDGPLSLCSYKMPGPTRTLAPTPTDTPWKKSPNRLTPQWGKLRHRPASDETRRQVS